MLIKFIGCLLVLSAFTNADQYNNDDYTDDDSSEDPTPDVNNELPAPVPAPRDVPKPSGQQPALIPKNTFSSYGQKPKDPPTPNTYSQKLPADPPAPNSYGQKLPKDPPTPSNSYGQKLPKDPPTPSNSYGQKLPKDPPTPSNSYGQKLPKDPPTPSNSYGSKIPVPKDTPSNSYGSKIPVPKDTPSNSYGSKIPVPKDTPSNSYGQTVPKDTPSNSYGQTVPKDPPSNSYGQTVPKDPPSNSYGQKVLERPAPLPKNDSPNPYGQRTHPKDVPSPNSYGGKKPIDRPIQPINPIAPADEGTDIIPSPSTCPTGNDWTDVVQCYECEIRKSTFACKSELPPAFDLCSNKTAILRMSNLFTDCLNDKLPTCHKMNENMALAFLMANYDSEVVDLNRRSECLFRTAKDPVMQCMSQCQELSDPSAIDNEPIVVCYNELQGQISGMLHDFADCIQNN